MIGKSPSKVKPRALLSVFDKTGIIEFARGLVSLGFELISTGGTARILRESDLKVIDVSELTSHPECFDGRVKTLHPAIHAPLLARMDNSSDVDELNKLGYAPIQVVAVNLYAFKKAASKLSIEEESELLEMIDIGGPTLIRASAKNHRHILIASNPSRYFEILEALKSDNIGLNFRQSLALEAFEHTADYDSHISTELHNRWVGDPISTNDVNQQSLLLPRQLTISAKNQIILRYGENNHQSAALYSEYSKDTSIPNLVTAKVEGGKKMSYNNYADADACLRLCCSLSRDDWPETPHVCVIVKHNNPCGAALGKTQLEAYQAALASDPESAFGSIICFNEPLEKETAIALMPLFVEVLMAPGWDTEAKKILMEKKNRRLLTLNSPNKRLQPQGRQLVKKPIAGGWLVQTEEPPEIDWGGIKTVTKKQPNTSLINSMKFGALVCEQVKSNAIILVQDLATVGIGPGQTSRVEAVKIATRRAGEKSQDSILISDAFFPFKDGIEQAHNAGVTTIVQPGGSIRDPEVIEEANRNDMVMVFTGRRLFRH